MPYRYLKPRNPYNPLLVVCVVGGIISVFDADAISQSVAAALPEWATYVWSVGLALSAGTALYGSWRNTLHGANIERLGLSFLAGICAVWGVAVIAFNPTHGWGAGLFYGGFALTHVLRIRVLNLALDLAKEGVSRDP